MSYNYDQCLFTCIRQQVRGCSDIICARKKVIDWEKANITAWDRPEEQFMYCMLHSKVLILSLMKFAVVIEF